MWQWHLSLLDNLRSQRVGNEVRNCGDRRFIDIRDWERNIEIGTLRRSVCETDVGRENRQVRKEKREKREKKIKCEFGKTSEEREK
ncbi:hypothetical protein CEXT_173541 [Caerostris extrusa]|uniref:Uncharacterized protein n=1 Tax=Caerostris extrusa TaxID=172846 RepID=A0AAV4RWZ1_CAEEX|nr:hypothetical protein CEXT_173541 [Caerostris extrusa]